MSDRLCAGCGGLLDEIEDEFDPPSCSWACHQEAMELRSLAAGGDPDA